MSGEGSIDVAPERCTGPLRRFFRVFRESAEVLALTLNPVLNLA